MHQSFVDRLRCPECHGRLVLEAFETDSVDGAGAAATRGDAASARDPATAIKEGVLLCAPCRTWFPVHRYVPVMLVFSTPMHERFKERHQRRLPALADYGPPRGVPERGERSVQETFTDEWNSTQESQFSFTFSLDELRLLHRNVWLQHAVEAPDKIASVLNVGIGLGQETVTVQDVMGGVEIVGVDLNFALLQSAAQYRSRPNFHLVIASLFHLPFEARSFDLVYSQGVLHHTYSTHEALRSIASFARRNGYVVIWIYGKDNLIRPGVLGVALRMKSWIELLVRPVVSRSPPLLRDTFFAFATVICHPLIKARTRHAAWSRRNSEHALRDWLSPRFAHTHDYNEVVEWFEDLGLAVVGVQSPAAYRRLFHKNLYGVGVTGRRLTADGE